jgi:predicted ester cyclase
MIVLDKGKAQLMTSYSDSAAEAVALGKLSPPLPYPPPPGTRVWPTTVPKPTQLAPAAAQKDAILRFNSHDLDAIASGLSSDASVLISILFDPQNREAYIAWLGVMFAAFPDLKVETLRNTDFANGWVADEIRITGTNSGPYMGHPATGKQIGLRAAWLGDYGKDGLAKVIKLYYDSVLIWNQLGLPNLNL